MDNYKHMGWIMDSIKIVCLANSRKISGRCIAGKIMDSGKWIRPVSSREH